MVPQGRASQCKGEGQPVELAHRQHVQAVQAQVRQLEAYLELKEAGDCGSSNIRGPESN